MLCQRYLPKLKGLPSVIGCEAIRKKLEKIVFANMYFAAAGASYNEICACVSYLN